MAEKLGRYEILEEIGQGGFAIVHRGRDATLDRIVALKELRSILLNDAQWVRRFRREARTIARLDHPHIVTIHDVYETDNRLCLVMRLVNGPSLEQLIAQRGPLPWSEIIEIMTAITNGLDYAHTQGILHRDLKPANILIDPERGPMLTDFGLAKLAGESSTSFTAGGGVVGTPHYIAPEVWEGRGTTAQSDIYALGCILYEMITGEKVFKGETPPAVMMAHFKPLELPDSWPGDVPAGVTPVLRKTLAHTPAERYRSATALAQALLALQNGKTTPTVEPATAKPAEKSGPEQTLDIAPLPNGDALAAAGVEPQPVGPAPQAAAITTEETQPPNPIAPSTTSSLATPADTTTGSTAAGATASPSSPAAPPHHRQDRAQPRRRSCWIGAAIVAGLLIAFAIGLGTFCSALGTGFNSAFFQPVDLIETTTEEIRVPPPDSGNTPTLELHFAGGELNIAPGPTTDLALLEATYNAVELKPKVESSGDTVIVKPSQDIGFGGYTTTGLQHKWNLQLGTIPMALNLNAGGAEAEVELGGLSLQNVTVTQGAANFTLAFSQANQVDMDTLEFVGGASNATLTGLANTNANKIQFQGGAGNYTLNFSGALQKDMEVKIEGGLGTINVIVPKTTTAEFNINNGALSNVKAEGDWQKLGNKYIISGDGPTLTIDADIGLGTLRLTTR